MANEWTRGPCDSNQIIHVQTAQSMATKHGKILSKSFPPELKGQGMENQQVLVGRRVGSVAEYLPQTQTYKVRFLDEQTPVENYYRFDQLFSLMIHYRVSLDDPQRKGAIAMTRMAFIPVKWSQWHQAIRHKEVDNGKQVRFETKLLNTLKGELTIGKIIPSRRRSYSAEEVDDVINEVLEICTQFGFEGGIPEAQIAIEQYRSQYVS